MFPPVSKGNSEADARLTVSAEVWKEWTYATFHLHWKLEVGSRSDVISELPAFQLRSRKNMDTHRKAFVVGALSEFKNFKTHKHSTRRTPQRRI